VGRPVDASAARGRALTDDIGAYLRLFIRRLNKYQAARASWERSVEKSQLAAQQH